MEFVPLTRENASVACSLFNSSVTAGEMLYKPFQEKDFADFFLSAADTRQHQVCFLAGNGSAFASGCWVDGEKKAYITMVLVRQDCRNRGLGRRILGELERALARESGAFAFEIIFFNPMNLEWIIPKSGHHDHPNAPGVDIAGNGYLFFKNCGYRDFAYQNSYYLNLADYRMPDEIAGRAASLARDGITVTAFDATKHTGMEALLDNLGNDLWKREIMGEIRRPAGAHPILIAEQNGTVCGFTGPLYVQPSGRGYFAGIGVHSAYRGRGIAKVLFNKLCNSQRQMGAKFMSLFTGENNPARNIYEAAGFRIVRTWADMRKIIKK